MVPLMGQASCSALVYHFALVFLYKLDFPLSISFFPFPLVLLYNLWPFTSLYQTHVLFCLNEKAENSSDI
jgi:hypothetical protein